MGKRGHSRHQTRRRLKKNLVGRPRQEGVGGGNVKKKQVVGKKSGHSRSRQVLTQCDRRGSAAQKFEIHTECGKASR